VKAMIGINQQKKAMMKQRLTSSVSIFFTSPYLTINIIPRAAIPTTTIDQPTISHLKNSDKRTPYFSGQNFKFQNPTARSMSNVAMLKFYPLGFGLYLNFDI
jgi:hypothetical protein